MSINWSFESYLDPQINEEITFHSLEHGVRGYKFKNAPENYGAALHEDWNDIGTKEDYKIMIDNN